MSETAERKTYDFADWKISDNDTEMLLDVVRTNIRTAFDQFVTGSWRIAWNDDATDNPGLLWWVSPFDHGDEALISLAPAQLRDALLEAVEEDFVPASKQTILEAIAAWRAAIDAAEAAARELPDDDDE